MAKPGERPISNNADDRATRIHRGLENLGPGLWELSLRIHDNPEIGLREVQAAEWLTSYLQEQGFAMEKGICGLPTAFRASYGHGKPTIAFVAEYDALPEFGHACGHNIIAASALGAAVALRDLVDEVGGQILVIGTPGEEIYGCKVTMVEQGAFDGVDAAMMVHPATRNVVITPVLACIALDVEFFGKPAHAAATPEEGINALDAMILSFVNINALRQQTREKTRIHGIILKGGEAPNIIPAYTKATFLVRAAELDELEQLKGQVLDCFAGAAVATRARLEYKWADITYAPMLNNSVLAGLFTKHVESLNRTVQPYDPAHGFGSTDMGNVSQVVPSLHPFVEIASGDTMVHSPEFAAAAASPAGYAGMMDGAKAMALTGADLLADRRIMDKVKKDFDKSRKIPR